MTWSTSAARPNAAKPASCASKARSTWFRTATSATSGSMSKALILVAAMSSLAFAQKHAKRAAPKEVKPVVHQGVRYVASHRLIAGGASASGAGYVEAWDAKKKKKLWEVRLYETANDPDKE